MHKKIRGANLVEYVIPMAVIAVVIGLTLFQMVSGGSLTRFFASSMNINLNSETGKATINAIGTNSTGYNTSQGGSMGGTPDNPVEECNNGSCTIDFGEFILSGIPDNFDEFVQANGTSGGTEELIALINQIADQLEEQGDLQGALEYRKLANLGHMIARIHEKVETKAESSLDSNSPFEEFYFSNGLTDSYLDVSFDALTGDLNISTSSNSDPDVFVPSMYDLYVSNDLGKARNDLKYNANFMGNDAPSLPSHDFVQLYDHIINNSKYSDTLKGITKELYLHISDLSFDTRKKVETFYLVGQTSYSDYENQKIEHYNPFSGSYAGAEEVPSTIGLNSVIEPENSVHTDLNSSLICVSGNNQDAGTNCHQ